MSTTPQAQLSSEGPQGLAGESIVISGMSGVFPQSHSVKEFAEILYNKSKCLPTPAESLAGDASVYAGNLQRTDMLACATINPVTIENNEGKWSHPEYPEYIGKIPEIDRFDSRFFMVHHHVAECMDPMAMKALEHSYQAIYDAGLNPKHLNDKKVGVFIAAALSDIEICTTMSMKTKMGTGLTGCNKTMYANRISYWLKVNGPSITIDNACCGFTVALEEAYSAMSQGICEAAIVGGASVCLFPHTQVHYSRCIRMSPDEKTKSFDQDANGCTKSSAVIVLLLQKAKDALRVYAELVHVKNGFVSKLSGETGQKFGFIRDPNATAGFLERFYQEAKVNPQAVKYIEAFGSATPEADKAELQAIEKVFCNNRTGPLFVGSVISNVGYTESASGGTAIAKVLLGYHNCLLASNLHCEKPREDVAAIRDGRMRIVTEHLPFRGSLAAVNCLSIPGVNSHVLLRGWNKIKDLTRYKASIPRLVILSARQEDYLTNIFEELKSRPIDSEELALLDNIHSANISGNLGRGYIILDYMDQEKKTISLSEQIAYFDDSQRPLWFVYSGMGSQWAGMGAQLMRIPIFVSAIERCQKALEPKGIDIVHIITTSDQSVFDNILHSFVGIAAVQIGLTDILSALGLHPDKIIGHSVGELGCAYADGCMTAEEMILSAYSRGKASIETTLIHGAMAAVGLGFSQISRLCPPEIEIACHNGPESSTISGPAESLREFVASLTAQGIFAKEVPCSNIAYHSRYIADAGPNLLRRCSEILPNPRARSARWVSTSVPQERWDEPLAQYCSAEYLTNNLLSPVLFEETSALIPSNAVLIEIAPHGLLQAILRRSLPQTCTNLSLAKRGHKDNALFLLETIGKLFIEGYTPKIQALYPKVEFPVSTGTTHLSHLVRWYHDETWNKNYQIYRDYIRTNACVKLSITKHDDEHSYLNGNIIQGRVLYPFAATLVAVWDILAMTIGLPKKEVSVRYNDLHLYSQPILHNQKSLKLSITLNLGNGLFEVLEGDSKVATGYAFYIPKNQNKSVEDRNEGTMISEDLRICSEVLYKHLSSRGYFYRDDFQSIHSVEESLSAAKLVWKNNWVTLIDGLLQLNVLGHAYEGITQPTHIRELTIDVDKHIQQTTGNLCDAKIEDILDRTRCGGVTIHNIKFRKVRSFTENKFKLFPMLSPQGGASWENQSLEKRKQIALHIGNIGDLDTLHWKEDLTNFRDGIKVTVEYAAINASDVNRATRIMPIEDDVKYYGMDFSGWSESGERVMGIACEGSCRSVVRARSELLWPVPAHWSLEDAATVPLAYVQAYYCLSIKSELKAGTKVLIHGGAGALGQAAISIALSRGCQVFTTVSDTSKKRHLVKLFPELNEDWIGNSRDDTFGDMVLNATNREGCEIIISCVKGNLKNISLKCAATCAITFDTVQLKNREKYGLGMYYLTSPRSYVLADWSSIFNSENNALANKLQRLVSDGICSGEVRPLSRVTYSPTDAARAFRLLAASRHRGRVLLRLKDSAPHTIHSFICSPESRHLIVCDGSALGMQFAHRLVSRGVKKLLIMSTKSISNHQTKLLLWRKMGIDVQILSENLTSNKVNNIITTVNEANGGPIQGIYVIATEVADERNDSEMAAIIDALDVTSRKSCPLLKYFCIITTECDVGHHTWTSRYKDGYPITALSLPAYISDDTKIDYNYLSENSTWIQSAVDLIEQTIGSSIPVQIARAQNTQKQSLVSLISAITGIDFEDYTLQQLRISESLPLVKSLLNDVYQVSLDDEDILKLTKKRLLDIEKNSTEWKFKVLERKTLGTFFSSIHLNEIDATANFIPVDGNGIGTMELGIDVTKDYLFIIPGLEGHFERFLTLSEHLKLPAIVLQPGLDRPTETPRELALRYSKILLDKFKLKKTFYLLAYECGIFAALELAGILEDNGLIGTLYCLGDGPEEMKVLLEEEISEYKSEEELQRGVVRHMFALMTGGAAPPAAVESCSSWSARVDACVRALLGRVPHTAQYVRALLQAAYERIVTVRSYDIVPRALHSTLVLMRVQRSTSTHEEHCSLELYSHYALQVRKLAAPMAHAAYDLRAPATVNSYLNH